MDKSKEIERSIIKKFRKDIWRQFTKAVVSYELINDGDKIMVCISGGKDSFLMAKCFQELLKHGKKNFSATYVVMDPGYSEFNRNFIFKTALELDIPITMFESNIFEAVDEMGGSPCYMCARMRRGYLYSKARELGCNKIALGHHFDDVIETTLLSMFYGSELKTMMPKLHSENFSGLELIRPLYLVREAAIIAWKNYNNLEFINCACRFTENCSLTNDGTSKRQEIKQLINNLSKISPNIPVSIFKSVDNVNLECILGYKKAGKRVSFLDEYDE